MAFTVNFYTFSKRERSTAVPAGAGRAVSCTADEPLNLLAPEISLDFRPLVLDHRLDIPGWPVVGVSAR